MDQEPPCFLDSDYYNLRQKCIELASSKESGYYKSKFDKYNNSQKSLFHFDRTPVLTLPPSDSLQTVVDNFNTFFTNKMNDICSKFQEIHNPQLKSTYEGNNTNGSFQLLTELAPTTVEEIKTIIHNTGLKTSSVDPLPQSVFSEDIEYWLPFICDLVNCSLSSGSIYGTKLAHLTPLIKDQLLDPSDLKNYRPISNLSFIGKLIERVVLKRLNDHLSINNLNIPFQSAYKKHHSTETLLIRIVRGRLQRTSGKWGGGGWF